jgi:hypothetical protein
MSGYDTTNKLPAKAQNDTYFFLKELEKEIASLRAENERLKNRHIFDCCEEYKEQQQAEIERLTERAELAEWYITESKTKIFYELLEDIAELRAKALIWHKWPEEKPGNDDPIERIAQSDDGKIYLTKTPPSQWCKGNSFRWAEIPRPEGE